MEDNTPHPCHHSTEAMADNILPLLKSAPSSKALTQENLNAHQRRMSDRKGDRHSDNTTLGVEHSGQEEHLKFMDAALSLGIPLYECFMDELMNSYKGTPPLERFMLENAAGPSGPIVDRLQTLAAGARS